MGQSIWRRVQSLDIQNKYTDDEHFCLNVNKLIALAFVPVPDVAKAYSVMIGNFGQDANDLLEYFETTWVGTKRLEVNGGRSNVFLDPKTFTYFRQSQNKTTIRY